MAQTSKDPLPAEFEKGKRGPPALFNSKYKSIIATVIGASDLKALSSSSMDPCCKVQLGRQYLLSSQQKKSGPNPQFNAQFTFPLNGEPLLRFQVLDRKCREVGFSDFNLSAIAAEGATKMASYALELGAASGVAGKLNVKIDLSEESVPKPFVKEADAAVGGLVADALAQAGDYKSVKIFVLEGRELYDPQLIKKMDPMVKVTMGDQVGESKVFNNAGKNPDFKTCFHLPYSGEENVKVELRDRERGIKSDKEIGGGTLVLKPAKYAADAGAQAQCELTGPKGAAGRLVYHVWFCKEAVEKPNVYELKYEKNELPYSPGIDESSYGLNRIQGPKAAQFQSVDIYVFDGHDLYDPQLVGKMDPYVCMRVGENELKSEVQRDKGRNPNFNTKFTFPYDANDKVRILLYDRERVKSNPQIGACKVSLTGLMSSERTKGDKYMPLYAPKGKDGGYVELRAVLSEEPCNTSKVTTFDPTKVAPFGSLDLDASTGSLMEKIEYLKGNASKYKSVRIFVLDGKDLYDPQWVGKMDPYCSVTCGKNDLKTDVVNNGGKNPEFNSLLCFPYNSERDIMFSLKDKEALKKDRHIGHCRMDLEKIMANPEGVQEHNLALLKDDKGKAAGTLRIKMEFMEQESDAVVCYMGESASQATSHGMRKCAEPSQYKTVKVHMYNGENLYDPQFVGKMDPYCKIRVGERIVKGDVMRDAGKNPDFSQTYCFPYNNEKSIKFDLYDRERVKRDRQIGTCKTDLEAIIAAGGAADQKTELQAGKKKKEGGYINYRVELSNDTTKEANAGPLLVTSSATGAGVGATSGATSAPRGADGDDSFMEVDATACSGTNPFKSVRITVLEGANLNDPKFGFSKMDPYVKCKLGTMELKSDVFKNAGKNLDFNTTFVYPYGGERICNFQIKDSDTVRRDQECGTAKLDLEPILTKGAGVHTQSVDVLSGKGKKAGTLNTKVEFMDLQEEPHVKYYAGIDAAGSSHGMAKHTTANEYKSVRVTVAKCEDLYNPQLIAKMDPYVKCRLGPNELQSAKFMDAGKNPVIATVWHFPYNNEANLRIEVWEHETVKRNREIGTVKVPLEPVITSGVSVQESTAALQGPKNKPGGTVFYRLEFLPESVAEATVSAADNAAVLTGYVDDGKPIDVPFKSVKIGVVNARDLYDPQMIGKLDPYVTMTIGEDVVKGEQCKNAGKNPDFDALFIFPYKNNRSALIEIKDKEKVKKDVDLGTYTLYFGQFAPEKGPHEFTAPVTAAKAGVSGGTLKVKMEWSLDDCEKAAVWQRSF